MRKTFNNRRFPHSGFTSAGCVLFVADMQVGIADRSLRLRQSLINIKSPAGLSITSVLLRSGVKEGTINYDNCLIKSRSDIPVFNFHKTNASHFSRFECLNDFFMVKNLCCIFVHEHYKAFIFFYFI